MCEIFEVSNCIRDMMLRNEVVIDGQCLGFRVLRDGGVILVIDLEIM